MVKLVYPGVANHTLTSTNMWGTLTWKFALIGGGAVAVAAIAAVAIVAGKHLK